MRTKLITMSLALVLALGAAACGEDDDEPAAGSGADSGEQAATPAPTEAPATGGDVDALVASVSKDLKAKPEFAAPSGEPPAELVAEDVVKGKGPEAKAGDNITMQYVGVSWSTGEQFDASWDRNEAFPFQLGAGMVIPGWDQGIVGMRKGGRRILVIPPDMGYGPQGSGPIGPNETLVFVVDLKKVNAR
jgi:peptidylprolyl isomerase